MKRRFFCVKAKIRGFFLFRFAEKAAVISFPNETVSRWKQYYKISPRLPRIFFLFSLLVFLMKNLFKAHKDQ